MEKYYTGKSVLVTGAGKRGRIGAEIAEHFAQEGANVIIHYRSNPEEAEAVRAAVQQLAGNATVELVQGDLGHPGEVAAIFTKYAPDIVINNAAVFEPARIDESASLEQKLAGYNTALTNNLDANTKSGILVAHAAIEAKRAAGKKELVIVFVTDAFIDNKGVYPDNLSAYTASKASLPAVVAMLGAAYGKEGVRVIATGNGPIVPPPSAPKESIDAIAAEINLPTEKKKPWVGAKAVAQAMDYGIRSEALNGIVIPVDGGRYWGTAKEV